MPKSAAVLLNKRKNTTHPRAFESQVIYLLPPPTTSHKEPCDMATETTPQSQPPKSDSQDNSHRPLSIIEQIQASVGIVVTSGIFLAMLGGAIYYFVYTAVPEKVKGEVTSLFSAKDGPFERIINVESETKKIKGLEEAQTNMQLKLVELNTKFDVYFDKTLDKNTAEQTVGRAVNRAIGSQDPIQQTVALNVAQTILDKAKAKRIVIDYKKANEYGLAVLKPSYKDDQKPAVKATVSKLAYQRNLKIPEPQIPKDNEKGTEYIIGGERMLDGTPYKDVTFVGSTIIYDRGWLGLENVRFINCTFNIAPEDAGKEFYLALFGSEDPIPVVTVRTPEPLPDGKDKS